MQLRYGAVTRTGPTAPLQSWNDGSGASATAEAQATKERAADGVAGYGESLPFADRIQDSFGRHDVRGIRAHLDGAASDACAEIGATAYASGTDIAFARSPDLHTAAHEATHVVQQTGGVQLADGVGETGDPYEEHANRVADLVVSGDSAEPLLDTVAGTGVPVHTSIEAQSIQKQAKVGLIDASQLPHPVPEGVDLPTIQDPQVSIVDNDARECRQASRSDVVGSSFFADNGLVFVDPRGDPWTLSVEDLVFTHSSGGTIEIPWSDIQLAAEPRATSFEQTEGILYPLKDDLLTRAFDAENTPNIVQAARLVSEVIAELKAQRVQYAELTTVFAGAIAGLGGASQLVRTYTQRTSSSTAPRRSSGSSTDGPSTTARTDKNTTLTLPAGGVRRPAPRHRAASVKQGTYPNNKNTVYDKSVDVEADIRAVNGGRATLGRNSVGELTATVNGRTYAVESNGTLSPRNGPGFHTLSRKEFKALGVYNKFGDSDRANSILTKMGIERPERSRALAVWQQLQ